jgi:uncharacterized protein YndB with AHSA1/START domain
VQRLTVGVDVDAPAQRVWDALVDWESQGEWMLGTQVRATAQDGRGVGGRISARTAVGPVGFTDPMTIVEWDPPRLCTVRHDGRVVRGAGIFRVIDLGGGRSHFLWTEELDLPFGALGRVGWVLARPVARAGVVLSLRRFARHVQRRTP